MNIMQNILIVLMIFELIQKTKQIINKKFKTIETKQKTHKITHKSRNKLY